MTPRAARREIDHLCNGIRTAIEDFQDKFSKKEDDEINHAGQLEASKRDVEFIKQEIDRLKDLADIRAGTCPHCNKLFH